MEKKLKQFLDDAFAPYRDFPSRGDVTKELLANLQERYEDLKKQGKSDDEAYRTTVDSLGDVSEIMEQLPHKDCKPKEKSSLGKTLKEAFKSVGSCSKFSHTVLKGSDLTDINLHESFFNCSEVRESCFDRSDLTDSVFRGTDLKNTSFVKANLTRTVFAGCDIHGVCFDGANLTDATFKGADLHGATFVDAMLIGTDFSQSDLTNARFDNLTLESVVFDSSSLRNACFRGAALHNVTFHHADVKSAVFDGTKMDKVTYALLKGAGGASLDKAIVDKG